MLFYLPPLTGCPSNENVRFPEHPVSEAGSGSAGPRLLDNPAWDDACDAVDRFLEREGVLATLTDPGAANRWKA